MFKKLIVILSGIVMSMNLTAQTLTSDELKKKQTEIRQQIDNIKNNLTDTRKNKVAGLSRLTLIEKKLQLHDKAIQNLNRQITVNDEHTRKTAKDITRLSQELKIIKEQYQKSIVYAYQSRNNYDFLNFIFSSSSFTDALKRVDYLKTYRNYRKEHAENIKKTKNILQQKKMQLEANSRQQASLLQQQQKERKEYEDEKERKKNIVNQLKSKEKKLTTELAAKAKADRELQKSIEVAINREMNKLRLAEAAKKKAEASNAGKEKTVTTTASKNNFHALTAAVKELSDNFENNKGKLPWPVDKGVIKLRFGKYVIPALKVEGFNNGLTVETDAGSPVKAVFEGKVTAVFAIEGSTAVIVVHGKYFTTYSNLEAVKVKTGDEIKTGQVIGKAQANKDGNGEIEFVIMEGINKQNLDPELWLTGK